MHTTWHMASRTVPGPGIVILVIAGLIFTGVGLFQSVANVLWLQRSVAVTGTVVNVSSHGGGTRNVGTYEAVIKFDVHDGTEVVFDWQGGGSGPQVGSQIAVRYDESTPSRAKVDSLFELWATPAMLIGIGLAVLLLGGWAIRRRRSVQPSGREPA